MAAHTPSGAGVRVALLVKRGRCGNGNVRSKIKIPCHTSCVRASRGTPNRRVPGNRNCRSSCCPLSCGSSSPVALFVDRDKGMGCCCGVRGRRGTSRHALPAPRVGPWEPYRGWRIPPRPPAAASPLCLLTPGGRKIMNDGGGSGAHRWRGRRTTAPAPPAQLLRCAS